MSTSATATTSSPPRATRPSHPRPTTYSGVAPTTAASHGPPIEPPPRTSSQRQVPTASTAVNGRPGSSRGAPPTDEAERERRRESLPAQPVGRSNSTSRRTGSGSSRANGSGAPQPQPVERQGSRRGENGGSRTGGGSSSGSQQMQPLSQHRGNSGRKETRFGEYILGQTLGEGEFGKVKLGWRRDGGVQVAIKLIRRDSVSPHPNRLSKIYREIAILRTLSHPNIVRLHEMVETDRHIGIILEYASGGELFDYILKHRYLKDPPACRLFAQLVSGVGYLHKKGIVHRDLKLENLLLDRNRNIIITDFGFANVFDPKDELKPEEEARLHDPGYLKELEKGIIHQDRPEDGSSLLSIIGPGQTRRRGDLMVTSCGSPCYAAPELVVSDGLYTGRKVDVWSCGVILYAMLAGYLPFDDDPANPDGDNINLLYKYIVSTPLTFPEYVTPHARDLLRRILVPDPRRRADLFEVARHSWLNPFADIVNKVTSATTPLKDVETATVDKVIPKAAAAVPKRSNSVRAPAHAVSSGMYGGLHHTADQVVASAPKASSDNKRRTVQVEYVKPNSETKRASAVDADEIEDAAPAPVVSTNKDTSGLSRSATNAGTSGRTFAKFMDGKKSREDKMSGPEKGKTRPVSYQYQPTSRTQSKPEGAPATSNPPSRRSSKDKSLPPIAASKSQQSPEQSPGAGESGRIAMPQRTNSKQYPLAASGDGAPYDDRPHHAQPEPQSAKGHKRANTVGGADPGRFLNRLMGNSPTAPSADRPETVDRTNQQPGPRPSMDIPPRKQSEKHKEGPPVAGATKPRRFSLIPAGFSLRSISGSTHQRKNSSNNAAAYAKGHLDVAGLPASASRHQHQSPQAMSQPHLAVPRETGPFSASDSSLAPGSAPPSAFNHVRPSVDTPRSGNLHPNYPNLQQKEPRTAGPVQTPDYGSEREHSYFDHSPTTESPPPVQQQPTSAKKQFLPVRSKKFQDAYEGETTVGGHGSSGPARRVMDFFRRRGVVRSKGA